MQYWKKLKAENLDKIPPKVWKTRKFDDILLWLCNSVYKQNTVKKWMKGCIFPFFMNDVFGITKTYRDITLTAMGAKVYHALLLNCIWPEAEKILKKNQMAFKKPSKECV